MPQPSTPGDITTINYTLEWPHLENPSNTTFAGPIQIDICRCQRADLPPQSDAEPGHIYTRFKCVGPEVRFKIAQEELWVLQAPHGAINMLRPATQEEQDRRQRIPDNTNHPTVYKDRKLLFLTGPCPRGRYQAYATQKWLERLHPDVRKNVSHLCLLIQPYEEDCSDETTKRAYAEMARYILQQVPGLMALQLFICDKNMGASTAASEFSILLRNENTMIVVAHGGWGGENREYSDASTFLDAMITTSRPQSRHGVSGIVAERVEPADDSSHDVEPTAEDEHSSDDDWTDAVMSPVSPHTETEKGWQLL